MTIGFTSSYLYIFQYCPNIYTIDPQCQPPGSLAVNDTAPQHNTSTQASRTPNEDSSTTYLPIDHPFTQLIRSLTCASENTKHLYKHKKCLPLAPHSTNQPKKKKTPSQPAPPNPNSKLQTPNPTKPTNPHTQNVHNHNPPPPFLPPLHHRHRGPTHQARPVRPRPAVLDAMPRSPAIHRERRRLPGLRLLRQVSD